MVGLSHPTRGEFVGTWLGDHLQWSLATITLVALLVLFATLNSFVSPELPGTPASPVQHVVAGPPTVAFELWTTNYTNCSSGYHAWFYTYPITFGEVTGNASTSWVGFSLSLPGATSPLAPGTYTVSPTPQVGRCPIWPQSSWIVVVSAPAPVGGWLVYDTWGWTSVGNATLPLNLSEVAGLTVVSVSQIGGATFQVVGLNEAKVTGSATLP